MVLWGVTTGRRSEDDWWFRGGVAPLFPEQWERLREGLPPADRDGDIVAAYARLLGDPDPEVLPTRGAGLVHMGVPVTRVASDRLSSTPATKTRTSRWRSPGW